MVSAKAILVALQALPLCWQDRADPRKPAQYDTIAQAVSAETRDVSEAAEVVALGYSETRFCLRVHEGKWRGKASGPWQVENSGDLTGLGLDETRRSLRAALGIWRRSWQCGPTWADRFTAYAGRGCQTIWPTLEQRVARAKFTRLVIWKEEQQA